MVVLMGYKWFGHSKKFAQQTQMLCKQKTAEDGGKSFCRLQKVSLLSQHGVCKMDWDKKSIVTAVTDDEVKGNKILVMKMDKGNSECSKKKWSREYASQQLHTGTSEVEGHTTTNDTHRSGAFHLNQNHAGNINQLKQQK
jgi:hypothetical protein